MRCLLLLALLAVTACQTDDGPSVVPDDPSARPASAPGVAPDTAVVTHGDARAARPVAPLRIEGACPFEGCQYGTWTTSAPTRLFATAHDTTRVAATLPAGTVLSVPTGHVLVTRLGVAVLREPAMLFRTYEDRTQAAAGDTLLVLNTVGEGAWRVWWRGEILEADQGVLRPSGDGAFPASQWWAQATTRDGTTGWLWMERTPPVRGADALAGPEPL